MNKWTFTFEDLLRHLRFSDQIHSWLRSATGATKDDVIDFVSYAIGHCHDVIVRQLLFLGPNGSFVMYDLWEVSCAVEYLKKLVREWMNHFGAENNGQQ